MLPDPGCRLRRAARPRRSRKAALRAEIRRRRPDHLRGHRRAIGRGPDGRAYERAGAGARPSRPARPGIYSRSRQALWKKGETSGHVQRVVEMRVDCDQDVLLLRVEQAGPGACHTGRRSCFYRAVVPGAPGTPASLEFRDGERIRSIRPGSMGRTALRSCPAEASAQSENAPPLLCLQAGPNSLSRLRGRAGEGACSRSAGAGTLARDAPFLAFQTNGESASCGT